MRRFQRRLHLGICLLAVIWAAVFASRAFPQTVYPGVHTWAPPNDLKMPVSDDPEVDAIKKASYDRAIDLVYNQYAEHLRRNGWVLEIRRLWSDPTVNADTWQEGNKIIIRAFGGLARYPGMNMIKTYAAVMCHELGHNLGGAPFYRGDNMSVEGQADRWAFRRCMKAIGFSLGEQFAAGDQLAGVLASMNGQPKPKWPVPPLPPYNGIQESHPSAACRMREMRGAATGKPRDPCWYNP